MTRAAFATAFYAAVVGSLLLGRIDSLPHLHLFVGSLLLGGFALSFRHPK